MCDFTTNGWDVSPPPEPRSEDGDLAAVDEDAGPQKVGVDEDADPQKAGVDGDASPK